MIESVVTLYFLKLRNPIFLHAVPLFVVYFAFAFRLACCDLSTSVNSFESI